jgi:hypothetical protein
VAIIARYFLVIIDMYIQSIGIAGSFFNNWPHAKEIFNQQAPSISEHPDQYKTTILKPNEARRTSTAIKIALQSAEESLAQSSIQADQLFSVFVSSDGDPNILQAICQALATPDKFVSPTQFHNSVHNAPAGYWSIGHQSTKGINSIACGDCSISGALLEAKSLLKSGEKAVLVVCFEVKSPNPLDSARGIKHSLCTSLIATDQATSDSLFSISMSIEPNAGNLHTEMENMQLDSLRADSPAYSGLPFFKALSQQTPGTIVLPYSSAKSLQIQLYPC